MGPNAGDQIIMNNKLIEEVSLTKRERNHMSPDKIELLQSPASITVDFQLCIQFRFHVILCTRTHKPFVVWNNIKFHQHTCKLVLEYDARGQPPRSGEKYTAALLICLFSEVRVSNRIPIFILLNVNTRLFINIYTQGLLVRKSN
jgi:hypothetical protein